MGRAESSSSEQGSVLTLLALVLFVLIAVSAVAVDLSALERRGQTLQNTADAAALAAVATWGDTASLAQTEAKVLDMMAQNGLDDPDVDVQVTADGNVVQVAITDNDPDVFLGGLISDGGPLERTASASFDICDESCNTVIELPAPFIPTSVVGSGDGYYPVAVRNRFYAINHGGHEIACVDRETQAACWSSRTAMPYGGAITGPVAHTVVVGSRIFFSAQEDHQLTLFCWQTLTESPCQETVIAPLAIADGLGEKWQQRGGGVVAVGQRVFLFTDDHRVHCVDTNSMTTCSGYAGGKLTGLGTISGMPPLDPALGVSGSNIDRVVDEHTGRIYHTLQIQNDPAAEASYVTGVHLDCWDTVGNQPCVGFQSGQIHQVSQRQAGRLFLHRTTDGTPNGVCSTGLGDIECVDLDGVDSPSLELVLSPLEAALPAESLYTNGMGIHTYHPATNRLILTSPRVMSIMHCWDFATSNYCGSLHGFANGQETQDYGFVVDGACLYGVGHTSVFWAFTPDMTTGCPGATVDSWVDKCLCGAEERWGQVSFNFDFGAGSPFLKLNVQVRDADDNLIYPTNGSQWIQMIGRPSDVIDLSEIPTTYDRVRLRVYVESDGTDPWVDPNPPTLIFGFRNRPYLVE